MVSLTLILCLINLAIYTYSFHVSPFSHLCQRIRSSKSDLNMVFDFLKDRAEEGIQQVQNIASKTLEGKLGEALLDSAEYIKLRNKIDAENIKRLSSGLSKSRELLLGGIFSAFGEDSIDRSIEERLTELEEVLLQADIGATTSQTILKDLRAYAKSNKVTPDDIQAVLRERLIEALKPPDGAGGINFSPVLDEPTVIFVIGANGMGKTTTIGKLAARLQNEANQTVLLGACDTFRAAAVDQLAEWSVRANVSIVKPEKNEIDPIPVVTRTLQRGKAEGYDVIIIDTSGRLSNNFELIEQLQDMKAAIEKEFPNNGAPHETLLVVDGSVGRNAVEQAAAWRKYVGVSGLAITKLDGTARGGFVVSVVRDQELPVKFIGVGEGIADLRDFEPVQYVDALLGFDTFQAQKMSKMAGKILQVSTNKSSNDDSLSQSGNDPVSRLRASFGETNSRGGMVMDSPYMTGDSSNTGSLGDSTVASKSSKRKKRPKPQNSKKVKKEAKSKKL
jgi:fused signal recognition particle receptor